MGAHRTWNEYQIGAGALIALTTRRRGAKRTVLRLDRFHRMDGANRLCAAAETRSGIIHRIHRPVFVVHRFHVVSHDGRHVIPSASSRQR